MTLLLSKFDKKLIYKVFIISAITGLDLLLVGKINGGK